MSKKRCLIFSLLYYPRFVGGAEVAVKEITDRLGSDFEFDMITLRMDKNLPKFEKIGNINVYRIGWAGYVSERGEFSKFLNLNKFAMPITAFVKAVILHRKNQYDVIWSLLASYNSFAALFFKKIFPKVSFVLTLQEGDSPEHIMKRAKIVWPLFTSVFKNADKTQAISSYLAELAKKFGSRTLPVVVPNGVDVDHFSKNITKGKVDFYRNKIKKNNDDIFLVTSSRLVFKNGITDVISALVLLPKNIKFAIAGDGELKTELEKQVEDLNLKDRVVFLGFTPHSDLPSLLKACDIFIRPSLSEGFGNSFVEAMACRIPVIATPVGGIVDFLIDKKTGFFCEPQNPESIRDAVNEIINKPEQTIKVIDSAFKMVKEKYDWNIVAKQMEEVLVV